MPHSGKFVSRATGFTLIELLIVVAIIGIIAAIAIPSLMRARVSANEAASIGDTRTVISSEAAYHAASGGLYAPADCLLAPYAPGCIPSYPLTGPTFLDSQLASLQAKSGYSRLLDGTPVPGGFACFSYHATPVSPGQSGVRGFAGDCSGRICFSQDGSPILPLTGPLPAGCQTLQ